MESSPRSDANKSGNTAFFLFVYVHIAIKLNDIDSH